MHQQRGRHRAARAVTMAAATACVVAVMMSNGLQPCVAVVPGLFQTVKGFVRMAADAQSTLATDRGPATPRHNHVHAGAETVTTAVPPPDAGKAARAARKQSPARARDAGSSPGQGQSQVATGVSGSPSGASAPGFSAVFKLQRLGEHADGSGGDSTGGKARRTTKSRESRRRAADAANAHVHAGDSFELAIWRPWPTPGRITARGLNEVLGNVADDSQGRFWAASLDFGDSDAPSAAEHPLSGGGALVVFSDATAPAGATAGVVMLGDGNTLRLSTYLQSLAANMPFSSALALCNLWNQNQVLGRAFALDTGGIVLQYDVHVSLAGVPVETQRMHVSVVLRDTLTAYHLEVLELNRLWARTWAKFVKPTDMVANARMQDEARRQRQAAQSEPLPDDMAAEVERLAGHSGKGNGGEPSKASSPKRKPARSTKSRDKNRSKSKGGAKDSRKNNPSAGDADAATGRSFSSNPASFDARAKASAKAAQTALNKLRAQGGGAGGAVDTATELPSAYEVMNAGFEGANGVYIAEGDNSDGVPVYRRNSSSVGVLFRYSLPNWDRSFWYISSVISDNAANDWYRVASNAPRPPHLGWKVVHAHHEAGPPAPVILPWPRTRDGASGAEESANDAGKESSEGSVERGIAHLREQLGRRVEERERERDRAPAE